jgi:hypothetical protein
VILKRIIFPAAGSRKPERMRRPLREPGESMRHMARVLMWITVAECAWTAIVAVTGGFAFSIGRVRVVSHDPARPALVAAVLVAIGYIVFGRGFDRGAEVFERQSRRAGALLVAVAAAAVILAAMEWGTFAASGADAFGYVSQSVLWRAGTLTIEQPRVATLTWPAADAAFAPLGYKAARAGHAIVPTYSPGLPMMMAAAAALAGDCALYYVVPALAAAAIWFTFLLGQRTSSTVTGVLAALLLASSPIFLYQTALPMSDVPSAAAWTGALYFALRPFDCAQGRPTRRSAALAGVCTAIAILIRPNIAPLAIVAGALVWWSSSRSEHATSHNVARAARVYFAVPVALALVGDALFNWRLYGSFVRSGYGDLSTAYSIDHVAINMTRYARWLRETETPLIALSLVALAMSSAIGSAKAFPPPLAGDVRELRRGSPKRLWREGGALHRWGSMAPRRWCMIEPTAAIAFAVMIAIVVGSYLAYAPFDDWSYLRFLLPALPVALIAMAACIEWAARPLPGALRAVAFVTLGTWLIGHGVRVAVDGGVPQLRAAEQRYVAVGRFAERATPAHAVYISLQHSGSLRYYTGRPSIRFDYINVDLHRAIADLERAGWKPYIVLEDWEETQFKEQFASASEEGRLAWRPFARFRARGINVYDPQQMHDPPRESIDSPPVSGVDCRSAIE